MAKIDVALDGPFAQPSAEEVAVTRAEGQRHGLAAKDGAHRRQMQAVNRGEKIPHKAAHAQAGGRDSKRNNSAQNDARAQRNLAKNKTVPLGGATLR